MTIIPTNDIVIREHKNTVSIFWPRCLELILHSKHRKSPEEHFSHQFLSFFNSNLLESPSLKFIAQFERVLAKVWSTMKRHLMNKWVKAQKIAIIWLSRQLSRRSRYRRNLWISETKLLVLSAILMLLSIILTRLEQKFSGLHKFQYQSVPERRAAWKMEIKTISCIHSEIFSIYWWKMFFTFRYTKEQMTGLSNKTIFLSLCAWISIWPDSRTNSFSILGVTM